MTVTTLQAAKRFRRRVARALALRGAVAAAAAALLLAGACAMALRLLDAAPARGVLALGIAGLAALAAGAAAAACARRAPPLKVCLAALDAASGAGGLFMTAGLAGADAWPAPAPVVPQVVWRDARLAGGLLLGLLFCAGVVALPRHVFVRARGERLELATVVEQAAQQAARLEEERLLPAQVAAALSNELAKISETGDASDPARVLEALDHINSEMARVAQEQAETLAGEQADMQAAQALVEMLAERMADSAMPAQAFDGAQEALAQFLASARLPASVMSNLLAAASAPGGLSPATLKELAERLKAAGLLEGSKLMSLSEMKLVDASLCKGAGACTNASACQAALAGLLAEDGPASDAASVLTAMCSRPGKGGVSRGRGDAMLTWTDPSSRESVTFKEQALRPNRMPGADQARLEGVSAAAPTVAGAAAPAAPGALTAEGAARGVTPQAVVLPRHKETVKRFFGNGE